MKNSVDKLIEVYDNLYDEVSIKFENNLVAKALLLDLINGELIKLWEATEDQEGGVDDECCIDEKPELGEATFFLKGMNGEIQYTNLFSDLRQFLVRRVSDGAIIFKFPDDTYAFGDYEHHGPTDHVTFFLEEILMMDPSLFEEEIVLQEVIDSRGRPIYV